MRRQPSRRPLLALFLALLAMPLSPARAADSPLGGSWKLVLIDRFTESDLLVFNVKDQDGKPRGTVTDTQAQFAVDPRITAIALDKAGLDLKITLGNLELAFHGPLSKEGVYSGTIKVGNQTVPAHVDRTTAEKVAPPSLQVQERIRSYSGLRFEKSPRVRVSKLMEMVARDPGSLTLLDAYLDLIAAAQAGGLEEKDVRKYANELIDGAKPYGDEIRARATMGVAAALASGKSFPALALALTLDAEKALSADLPAQIKAGLAEATILAARNAGDGDALAAAEKRLKGLEAELDADYHKRVPPFKPEPSMASHGRKSDRVVVMELFTGAECPPCVAADVAFEALDETYKPSELVTIQYHLHIPGPDPLTNADSEERGNYYTDFSGTPATYFNGKVAASGGGPMGGSKEKYDDYKKVIDKALLEPSQATVDLKVDRQGDDLKIRASAVAKDSGKNAKVRLRLLLIEEQVRYVGGNNLRFHKHVVRAMPGGVAGKALAGGAGTTETTLNLGELKKNLEEYLSHPTPSGRNYPKALPPIPLANLSVIALVQDDGDSHMLNAAIVKVPDAKPATP